MGISGEADLAEIGARARRLQDLVAGLRATVSASGVRVEVAADGRITALSLPDAALAQVISTAHQRALAEVAAREAELRGDFTADPAVAATIRRFLARDEGAARSSRSYASGAEPVDSDEGPEPNPYAFPREVRARYERS
ncbi:hypothetical protein [Nocardia inohanensis]|uniref:hypothetical protein n=1 Tax=Nocardia inohanensis TaxID=209246 RepID=UPI0008375F82|nr:hypothetical protein [Nocardia inohanensis]